MHAAKCVNRCNSACLAKKNFQRRRPYWLCVHTRAILNFPQKLTQHSKHALKNFAWWWRNGLPTKIHKWQIYFTQVLFPKHWKKMTKWNRTRRTLFFSFYFFITPSKRGNDANFCFSIVTKEIIIMRLEVVTVASHWFQLVPIIFLQEYFDNFNFHSHQENVNLEMLM